MHPAVITEHSNNGKLKDEEPKKQQDGNRQRWCSDTAGSNVWKKTGHMAMAHMVFSLILAPAVFRDEGYNFSACVSYVL